MNDDDCVLVPWERQANAHERGRLMRATASV